MSRKDNLSPHELEDLFVLVHRIFADYRNPRRGAFGFAYLFAETKENADSTFLRAIELDKAGMITSLGTCGGAPGFGYEGFDYSLERLQKLGWPVQKPVVKVEIEGNINTASEAVMLAKHAASIRGDVAIMAPPYHLVRAFLTTVSVFEKAGLNVQAYPVVGIPLPWSQTTRHSQGVLVGTREQFLTSELAKIGQYQAPEFGGMLTPREILRYLNRRGDE